MDLHLFHHDHKQNQSVLQDTISNLDSLHIHRDSSFEHNENIRKSLLDNLPQISPIKTNITDLQKQIINLQSDHQRIQEDNKKENSLLQIMKEKLQTLNNEILSSEKELEKQLAQYQAILDEKSGDVKQEIKKIKNQKEQSQHQNKSEISVLKQSRSDFENKINDIQKQQKELMEDKKLLVELMKLIEPQFQEQNISASDFLRSYKIFVQKRQELKGDQIEVLKDIENQKQSLPHLDEQLSNINNEINQINAILTDLKLKQSISQKETISQNEQYNQLLNQEKQLEQSFKSIQSNLKNSNPHNDNNLIIQQAILGILIAMLIYMLSQK